MKVEKLKLHNFKSIKDADIEFNNKSILLGANASGKSNLISSFKFINYILMYGLEDAVSLMGGMDNLINLNAEKNDFLEIGLGLSWDSQNNLFSSFKNPYSLNPYKSYYSFKLGKKRNNQYKILNEEFELEFNIFETLQKKDIVSGKVPQSLGNVTFLFNRSTSKIISTIKSNNSSISNKVIENNDSIKMYRLIMETTRKDLMLSQFRFLISTDELFKIYDFDPKLLKTPSQITSKRNLEEDGSNIGVVLERLLRDKNNKQKLLNLLKICLPNIEEIQIKKNIDKSVSYQMLESFYNTPLYSQFLSDGTVSMLALVISLYFNEDKNIIILEEPERNLHPQVIRKLVDMLNEVSENKQIIITTHNSEIVKHSKLNEILCIKRDKLGLSNIEKPENNVRINEFLKNELGIDDLFLDGIL